MARGRRMGDFSKCSLWVETSRKHCQSPFAHLLDNTLQDCNNTGVLSEKKAQIFEEIESSFAIWSWIYYTWCLPFSCTNGSLSGASPTRSSYSANSEYPFLGTSKACASRRNSQMRRPTGRCIFWASVPSSPDLERIPHLQNQVRRNLSIDESRSF